MLLDDGSYRDTVVFSIIEHEWLSVKNGLTFKLEERKNDKKDSELMGTFDLGCVPDVC